MDVFWNSTHYKGDSVQKCAFPNLHCMCVIHSNLKTTISTRKKKHEFQLSLATNNSKNLLALAGLCLLF